LSVNAYMCTVQSCADYTFLNQNTCFDVYQLCSCCNIVNVSKIVSIYLSIHRSTVSITKSMNFNMIFFLSYC